MNAQKRPHRLRQFVRYPLRDGQVAQAVLADVADMGKFYANESGQRMIVQHDEPSLYVDRWFRKDETGAVRRDVEAILDDMRDHCARWTLPIELRRQALAASSRLIDVFREVSRMRYLKKQETGFIDPERVPELYRDLRSGKDPDPRLFAQVRPSKGQRPKVAVLGSAGNTEMHRDPSYIPRIAALTTAIAWACEAAEFESVAVLTRGGADGYVKDTESNAYLIHATYLKHEYEIINARALAPLFHVALWQAGIINLNAADFPSYRKMRALFKDSLDTDIGTGFQSRDGGRGVSFARDYLEADVVIAIGEIQDFKLADVYLGGEWSVLDAAREIAEQAKLIVLKEQMNWELMVKRAEQQM